MERSRSCCSQTAADRRGEQDQTEPGTGSDKATASANGTALVYVANAMASAMALAQKPPPIGVGHIDQRRAIGRRGLASLLNETTPWKPTWASV